MNLPADQKSIYRFLAIQTIASVVALQAWTTLFNNFAVEVAGLDGRQAGIIQSVREVPGFLALLAVFILLVIREDRLSALSVICLGTGTALAGFFPSFTGLMFTTLVMSFGFHYFETTNQSLTLQHFDSGTSPLVFGHLRSLSALASIGVGIFVFIANPLLGYTEMFLLLGLLTVAAGLWGLLRAPAKRDLVPQRRQMVFRRAYLLFYILTFLAGARRQIFVAFSVFLMVKIFGFTVAEITGLFVINSCINYVASPLLGRAIVRFGERRLLSLEYLGLIFVFITYAFSGSKWVIAAMYIVDSLLYTFAIGIRTYFQKVADPRDIAPSMAVGFTINHIAAVIMPALGGVLWLIDYRIPFLGGAVLSLISLLAVQWIPRHADLRVRIVQSTV
ncbi:MAG: MFS transporter [Desulfuromonadales bacterium]|nr:MFS transporter [Desulfuromonadales bacterium]